MAYHKIEHYPSNFQGMNVQGTVPVTKEFTLKPVVYQLWQIDTATTASDTIFGDSYYPSIAGSDRGWIGVERLEARWKWTKELLLNGYVEHSHFRKTAPTAAASIDKDVYDFYGVASLSLTKELSVEGGFRHFFSVGNWQAMHFRSWQDTPEAAVSYKIDKDRHAYLIYQYINFQDNNDASRGQNDYYGHQITFEIKTLL